MRVSKYRKKTTKPPTASSHVINKAGDGTIQENKLSFVEIISRVLLAGATASMNDTEIKTNDTENSFNTSVDYQEYPFDNLYIKVTFITLYGVVFCLCFFGKCVNKCFVEYWRIKMWNLKVSF